tara:strand:- start:401 stop:580 length:180 start_codon:yes stop_codon:yes gene_type:complete
MIKDLDELANLWNKTKNLKYKKLWYKTVKETYGPNTIKRWGVSSRKGYKRNDSRDTNVE